MKNLSITNVSAALILICLAPASLAVSPTSGGKVKDYCIPAHNGKVTKAQVAIATRKGYRGVIPKITARPSGLYPNCFDSRFTYKGELKRITFNCSGSKTVLSPETRSSN